MSTKTQVIAITLTVAVPALILGKIIWPPSMEMGTPSSTQLPFFILMSIFESISLGLGVSFLILGWPFVQKLSGNSSTLSKLAFLSIAWYLLNWWAHDNLHAHIGMNLQKLLFIEYGFHTTMMIAGAILAYFFWTTVLKKKI